VDIAEQPGAARPRGALRRLRLDRYLAANIALWVLTYLLITLRGLGMDTPAPMLLNMAWRRVLVCIAAVFFCAFIQRLLLASRPWTWARRVLLAAGLAIGGSLLWAVVNTLVFYAYKPVMPFKGSSTELLIAALFNVTGMIWSFIAWCAVVFAMGYDEEVREKTLRLVQTQALAAESQNQMLRYQINPHFLFNTLNALSSLILQKDTERAEKVVLSLSKFLRVSLEKDPRDKISLADEIETQRQYLPIEEIRFGDRLRFEEATPADLADALVPSLILQPLVENAVKYGVARSTGPVRVTIAAEAHDGRLRVTVADDGAHDIDADPVRLGVGLENVRRRLEALYGDAGRLTCGPGAERGFTAAIELPLERR
jgi:two-component system LytT family sensor kinase